MSRSNPHDRGVHRRRRVSGTLALVVGALLAATPAMASAATTPAASATTAARPAPERSTDVCPAAPRDRRFDAATRRDGEFNERFEHGFAQVEDVRMHYVSGGTGEQVMVLLHGWRGAELH